MTVHIDARRGHIAEKVVITGDPLRARYIAEFFLERPICYTHTRGMLGFTGTYKGEEVSIQGTGIGMPSTALYTNELVHEFGVKKIVRVGTCGALQEKMNLRDLVLVSGTATSSNLMKRDFAEYPIPQQGNFNLLKRSELVAKEHAVPYHLGSLFSVDLLYGEGKEAFQSLKNYGVLGIDMETAALYYLAAKYSIEALAILTVSHQMFSSERLSVRERESKLSEMAQVALDTLIEKIKMP